MEGRDAGLNAKELLEKHRNNTRKYLHLVDNSALNCQKIDPEATKQKIEQKYGLNLKTPGLTRTNSVGSQPNLDPGSDLKSSLSEQKAREMIENIKKKYFSVSEPASPSVPTTLISSFPKQESVSPKGLDRKEMSLNLSDAMLIDLSSPSKTTDVDLLSDPISTSSTYTSDLSGISFDLVPGALADILPTFDFPTFPVATESPSKNMKLRSEETLNTIISEVVSNALKINLRKPVPPPKRLSPIKMKNFDEFLGGKTLKEKEEQPVRRHSKMKVTKAKIDPETVLSNDTQLQHLLAQERKILTRLQYIICREIVSERSALEREVRT